MTFEKLIFFKNWLLFKIFIGIFRPGSTRIERGMKKYFWGLILRFFGLIGSSLVPGEGPRKVKGKSFWYLRFGPALLNLRMSLSPRG